MADKAGSYVWVEAIGNMLRNEEGKVEKMAGIAVEILKRKQKEEELRSIATTDPLTGIANRGVFDDRFAAMMEQYLDHGQGFSLVLLDIDNFKRINDTWGHSTGDRVLKYLVSICRNNLRSSDLFARIGGEEFAVLIGGSNPKSALGISERIRKDVAANPLSIGGETISFTVSVGYGSLPGPHAVHSVSSFYTLVDRALYMAKNRGRNRVMAVDDLEDDMA
jgi:diguanylate cyclase (GGDEF)-like protein